MIHIRIGGRYVQYVDEKRLLWTDNVEEAGAYSERGALIAHELIKKHLGVEEEVVN